MKVDNRHPSDSTGSKNLFLTAEEPVSSIHAKPDSSFHVVFALATLRTCMLFAPSFYTPSGAKGAGAASLRG